MSKKINVHKNCVIFEIVGYVFVELSFLLVSENTFFGKQNGYFFAVRT